MRYFFFPAMLYACLTNDGMYGYLAGDCGILDFADLNKWDHIFSSVMFACNKAISVYKNFLPC